MATPSYKELTSQIDKLQKQAEAARTKEMQTVIAQIHQIMGEYGITGDDLGFRASKGRKKLGVVTPKYQDPASGATWTGRGRAPTWIAGKERSKYAI